MFEKSAFSARPGLKRMLHRLQHPLSPEQLIQLNGEFSDIIEYGQCEKIEALLEEDDEPLLTCLGWRFIIIGKNWAAFDNVSID
jgi:hypothetical protein